MGRVTLKSLAEGKAQIENLPNQIINDVEFARNFGFDCKPSSGYGITLPDFSSDELILIAVHKNGSKPSLEDNEVVIYNSDTNYIKFKDSEIEIKSGSVKITLKDSKVSIEGDLEIDGKLKVTKNIESDEDIKAGSISLKNHTHQYITTSTPAGPGNTGAAQ